MARFLAAIVIFCARHAAAVTVATIIVTVGSAIYASHALGINSDTSKLIAPDAVWQQAASRYDEAFPRTVGDTTVVIDGHSADAVADGTTALAAALQKRSDAFKAVWQPDGGPFFDEYGLMFLSTTELSKVSDQVAEAQPLLGPLAADMSLHGLFGVLDQALMGIEQGEATADKLAHPMKVFADGTRSVVDGHPKPVDWGSLMTGQPPRPEQLRHFIDTQPKLDYGALQPGARASEIIRQTAAGLHLAEKGVRVRLTGDVALEDDEIASVMQGAVEGVAITVVAVLVILYLALRSPQIIAAIMATIFVGLAVTSAFAAAAVGTLNMISIAFVVLFIGIGVDFGIQFSMRFRAELFVVSDGAVPRQARAAAVEAIVRTGRLITVPLGIAALATSVGFFSFLPTSYRGVSELGLISGVSMIVALAATLTVLPALLALLRSRSTPEEAGLAWAAPIDRAIGRHAGIISTAALVLGVLALGTIPFMKFDANPLHLKDPSKESLQTALELTSDPLASPFSIDVLVPDVAAARLQVARLETLPEVKQVIWAGSLVPEDQPAKLDILGQMQLFLGPLLAGNGPSAAVTPADEHQAVEHFVTRLSAFMKSGKGGGLGSAGSELLDALSGFLASPGGGDLASLRDTLLGGLSGRLATLTAAVSATPLTLDTMPASIRDQWIGSNGLIKVEAFPKGDMNDPVQMDRFVAAVRAVSPNAAGAPVAIMETGHTVSHAFVTASLTAIVAITLALILILRRARDVALVLLPLLLAGLYSIATCVLTGLAFNYANVIAVPLLMGIGVAFDIYFVSAWRSSSGPLALLQTPTARAVLFSACTTSTAFGSLALSHHWGTASMGLLMLLTLALVVGSTMIVQPALMTVIGRRTEPRLATEHCRETDTPLIPGA